MWSASIASNLADGILQISAGLLALSLTRNPVLISLMPALAMLPWLLFAIPIGGIVDRVNRRKLLSYANILRAGLGACLALLIATHSLTIGFLYLFIFLSGICEVTIDTTSQAMIPRLLDKSHFERANARLQISESIISGFIGAPISSFLFALAVALPFAFTSTGYAVAAFLIFIIPVHALDSTKTEKVGERETFRSEIQFGIRYLASHQILRRLVITTTSIGFFYSASNATTLLYLVDILKMPKQYFGTVMMVQGIGGIIGALIVPKVSKKFGRGIILAVSIFGGSLPIFFLGLAPNIYIFIAIGILAQLTVQGWNIVLMSTYQNLIPNELYGRIHGARRTLVWGVMPLGSLFGGFLATHGLRLPFFVGGAVATAIALFNFSWLASLNQERLDAER